MNRLDRLFAVLSICVIGVRVHAHWAGAIQCDSRRNVFELGWSHQAKQAAHWATIELEHAERVTTAEQLECRLVGIQIQLFQNHGFIAIALDVCQGVFEHG